MAKKPTEAPKSNKTKELTVAGKPNMPAVRKSGIKIAGKGFENLEREDILLPRLKLLQAMSPEVTETDEKPGTFFLNLSNKNVGEKIIITPVMHYRSRIKWNPKDDGGGIDCSSADAKTPSTAKYAPLCSACSHKDWDNTKEKKKDQVPSCVLFENFVILIGDSSEPVIMPMSKSQAKVAKKFYSMAALKGGDMFDFSYQMTVVKEKAPTGEVYFNFSVSDIGKKTDEKKRITCEQLWATLSKANLTVKMEPEDGSVVGAAKVAGAQAGKF
jgi:hypothetical protein